MKSKEIILTATILAGVFLICQCRSKPVKQPRKQPVYIVNKDDSLVFKQLRKIGCYHKADSFYIADVYDSAVLCYFKTLAVPKLYENPKLRQEIYNRIGLTYIILSDYKKARYYLGKAMELHHAKDSGLIDANTFDFIGVLNESTYESDSALLYLNKAYNILVRTLGDKSLQIAKLNLDIGNVYRWNREDYYNAEKFYYKALQIFEMQRFDRKDDLYFRLIYSLASTNKLKNDFNKSLSYGLQALQLAMTVENNKRYLEICYGMVANIYLALKDYEKSIEFYNRAIDINGKALKINKEYKALYLSNLAWANYKIAKYNRTITYCNQAFEIFNSITPDYNEVSSCHEYLGLSNLKLNLWSIAFRNFKDCVAIRTKYLGPKHPGTADAYSLFGKYYDTRHNLDSALYYYQKAIISCSSGFNDIRIDANPIFSQSTKNIELIDYIASKASDLKQKYTQHPEDTVSLTLSLRCYVLLDSLVSFSRKSMDTEKSKLSFSTNSNEMYEGAIDCAFHLYQVKKEERYIRQAFRFFEKNKYLLLLEKLKMAEAGSKAGIPDSLVQAEQKLNAELKFAQDKLSEEQNKKDVSSSQVQSLNARIFQLMRDIEKLHAIFEHQYPNYFKIKYQDITTNLGDLQKYSLLKRTDVIQYFWGENSIYMIGVTENHLIFFKINNNQEFKDFLADFIGMLHEVNLTSKERFLQYARKGNCLYDLLVKPALEQSNFKKPELQTLTIIPDGMLSKLSFDALVSISPKTSKFSYKSLRYLAYDYNIQYAYSSNILLTNPGTDRRKFMNNLLGFGYAGDDTGYGKQHVNSLPGTVAELAAVSKYFHSRIYLGENASEHNFKKNVSNYDIVHLALHGSADEEKESGSKLIFRNEKDTVDDGLLYANEIYNLKLKAKLVVLSACETGIGKNYQGEGVFSLARAFAYAGCPSVVISLWKVNDQSTAEVMGYFYKHLSNGEEIGQSLQKAKLNYLENTDEIAAQPVFWASFVAFGDMSPITMKNHFATWYVLLIILVGGFLVYWFGLKKAKKFFR